MKHLNKTFAIAAAIAFCGIATKLAAQTESSSNTPTATAAKPVATEPMSAEEAIAASPLVPVIELQNYRPEDQRGINVFEAPKTEGISYQGFKLFWGAAFTQQFQGLDHSNHASPVMVSGVNTTQLIPIGHGFNNAEANLYLNAQLAPGIRVQTTMYLSSRHHSETWVKDGFLLMDASPIDFQPLNSLMKYVTVKFGDFEINYGDTHFRRTDNGNAMRNPLVGNYIMDAFTNEIGGEIQVRANGLLGILSMTGGENKGMVTTPEKRAPSYIAKLGFDRQLDRNLRVRLMGSMYTTSRSASNTLYSGDRSGSRYYDVMQNTTSTEAAQAWSGSIQPGFASSIRAFVFNPFVKYQGLELYGNLERAKGRAATETTDREFKQYVGEAVYRFLPLNQLFVAGRYNRVSGRLSRFAADVSVNRSQIGGGWFLTPNMVLKAEYVRQSFNDFPKTDIRNGGQFKGFMVESSVAF